MSAPSVNRIEDSRRFELLLNGIVEYAIFMLEAEGRLQTWNAGAEALKGYSAEEIIGKPFSTFYMPEDGDKGLPERELTATRDTGRFHSQGWRVRKDGTRFWALVVTRLTNDGQHPGTRQYRFRLVWPFQSEGYAR